MKQPLRVLISCRPEENSGGKRSEQNDAVFEFAAWLARTSDINVRGITTFIRPWPSSSISKLGGKYHKKSDRSHGVLWAKELQSCIVFLRPLGLRLTLIMIC